jgi:hypothetical protein
MPIKNTHFKNVRIGHKDSSESGKWDKIGGTQQASKLSLN